MTRLDGAIPAARSRRVSVPPLRRKRRKRSPDGAMSLVEHLRELRGRIVTSLVATIPGVIIGLIFYKRISEFLVKPFCEAGIRGVNANAVSGSTSDCTALVQTGLTAPFNTALTVAAMSGILLAAPVWLYQLWAFVTPGLHKNERRWSVAFLTTAIPLFFSGAVVAYLILPKAISVLLSFTIKDAYNQVDYGQYLSILVRLILVFGLAFEMPVFIAMLNVAGILSAKSLIKSWRYTTFGIFVFAAVATPTGDPFTMLTLALPMVVLFLAAYVFCVWNDRRRARLGPQYDQYADDETSPLDERPSRLDDLDTRTDDGTSDYT